MEQQITSIKSAEFMFCRYFVALLVWSAIIFSSKLLVLVVFIILVSSAILTVKYAPMILFWRYTFGLVFKSKDEVLNVKAMRFAHSLGSIISGICVILLYFGNPAIGWGFVWFLAIMKTISAFGFCPASKVYVCMSNGGCCALTKKHDR
jgi:hypothetical protein